FWEWFKDNKVIPLLIVEGGKKSLSAFSQNIVAIALYGCLCGYDSKTGEIKESLRPYVEGRDVYIAFDQDKKPKTRRTVNKAVKKLAKAMSKLNSRVYQVTWDIEDGKGVDDVIKNKGGDYFKERMKVAKYIGTDKLSIDLPCPEYVVYNDGSNPFNPQKAKSDIGCLKAKISQASSIAEIKKTLRSISEKRLEIKEWNSLVENTYPNFEELLDNFYPETIQDVVRQKILNQGLESLIQSKIKSEIKAIIEQLPVANYRKVKTFKSHLTSMVWASLAIEYNYSAKVNFKLFTELLNKCSQSHIFDLDLWDNIILLENQLEALYEANDKLAESKSIIQDKAYKQEKQFLAIEKLEQAKLKALQLEQYGITDRLNQLTREANLTINQPSLEGVLDKLPRTGKLFIKSAKKTGKSSKVIDPLIKEWKEKKKPIISIVPRILLYKEQVIKWEITAIDSYGNIHKEFHESIALCFDSLGKLTYLNWSGALVIFDEIRQGLKHNISSSTLEEMRSYILKLLQEKLPEAINGSGLILGCDADLTDVEVNYIDEVCPDGDTFILNNEYQEEKGIAKFDGGKIDDDLTEIKQRYQNGDNLFIFCDAKSNSKAIHDALVKLDPQGTHWLINGDTTERPEIKEIIENNINKSIKEQQPRSLIFTTSMSTGVSIDGIIDEEFNEDVYEHFNYGFVSAVGGILEPVEVTQAMGRNRNNIDFTVHAGSGKNKDGPESSCDPEVIRRQITKRNHNGLNILSLTAEVLEAKLGREPTHIEILDELRRHCDPETGYIIDPHLDLYCNVKGRGNYADQNFDLMLFKQLQKEGFIVAVGEICEQNNLDGDFHRSAKDQDLINEGQGISEADDITLEMAYEYLRTNATVEQRRQARKALLKNELPGIDLNPGFIYKNILKDRRRRLNGHKLFWFFHHPEITKEIDLGHYVRKLQQFSQGTIFLPDIKNYSIMIEELKALGVLDLVNLEKPREISKHDPKVIKFMEEAYLRRYKTYTNLGLTITKKTDPMRFIHRLMQRVGLGLTCTRTEKVGDSKTRYYSLNKGLFNDPDRLAILKSLDRKFLGELPTEEKMAETGIPENYSSGTGQPEKLSINESAVPVEKDQQESLIDNPIVEDETGIPENYSSGTGQPEKLSINESAVPVEKDLKKDIEVEETLDYYEVIASIDMEMERLGWSKERGIGYILGKYGVTSRFNLDDVQLISFWNYLRKEAICR
ncbi:MAG: plasmid replication protein, CyRepA1 family, partial [Crocosphaera sp.]